MFGVYCMCDAFQTIFRGRKLNPLSATAYSMTVCNLHVRYVYKCECICVLVSCGRPHPQRTQSGQRRWSDKKSAARPPARPLERKRSWVARLRSDRTANSNYELHSPPKGYADTTARTNLRARAHKQNTCRYTKDFFFHFYVTNDSFILLPSRCFLPVVSQSCMVTDFLQFSSCQLPS